MVAAIVSIITSSAQLPSYSQETERLCDLPRIRAAVKKLKFETGSAGLQSTSFYFSMQNKPQIAEPNSWEDQVHFMAIR